MLRYLLDTNICIDVIKARPRPMLESFNRHAGHMAISAITLSELLHGVEKSAASERNLAAVENFCSRLDVLPYGPKASLHYGQIRTALERRGTPIGVNDLHIAAHARSEGLTLVSNNLREFERVEAGLIQSLSQVALLGLSAWAEVGGIASSLCSKAFLPQPIST